MIQRDEGSYLIVDYESPLYKEKLPILYRKKNKRTTRIVLVSSINFIKILNKLFFNCNIYFGKNF